MQTVDKTQKVTAILQFHNNGDKNKLTEHNSTLQANTSSEAGTSSEVKSASRSKDGISSLSLGESYSNIPSSYPSCFPLFSRCFSKSEHSRLTRVRPAELLSNRDTTGSSSSCHRCFLSDRELMHCCNKCLRPILHLLYVLWCHRHRW